MNAILARAGALAFVISLSAQAVAQEFGAAFAGFDTGSDEPIKIEADRLEVRDPDKLAIYSGNVQVRQGDSLLKAPELRVFYTGEPTESGAPGSQVSRIEAGPAVTVTSGDQSATGSSMVLDMGQEVITMSGNVVLTQGPNVVRGERLIVNLQTKQGRMEGGRVQTLITPSGGAAASQ
jgi:lipopolysaccharide export system protein LptA